MGIPEGLDGTMVKLVSLEKVKLIYTNAVIIIIQWAFKDGSGRIAAVLYFSLTLNIKREIIY